MGKRFRDMPIRRADRGGRAEGRRDLPARGRRAGGGRSRDHLHGDLARAGRRARAVTPATRATRRRIGPPRIWAVDVRSALGIVGTLAKYLPRPRRSCPRRWPSATASPSGPSWARARSSRQRARAGASRGAAGPARRPGGLPRRRADLARRGRVRRAALPALGRAAVTRPVDAYFESMSGFTTTGASVLTDIEAVDRSLLLWRSADAVARRHGDHRARARRAAAPARRRPPAARARAARPGDRGADVADPRHGAAALGALHGADRLEGVVLAVSAGRASTSGWISSTRSRTPSRRCRPAASPRSALARGCSPRPRSGSIASSCCSRERTSRSLYRRFVRREPRVFARDEEFRLYLGCVALGAIVLAVSSGRRASPSARRPSATASSRRSR